MDTAQLIAKYDQPVPRYTSYPTAPHFAATVDAHCHAGWLRALPRDVDLSLYLHVPFCRSLCLFCACHTTVVRGNDPLLSYAEDLLREIDTVAAIAGDARPVRHIHWGGGTPTVLPPTALRRITNRLRDRFTIEPDAEIAVEVDPRTLSDPMIETLADLGVNRVSLGVQDFDPRVQRTIGRFQSLELTGRCVERLRSAGIGSINLDLVYGLPLQTEPGVADTVALAMTLKPDRVAVFGYAHVPWMKKHQALIPTEALPGPTERFHQRRAVESVITAMGYTRIGMDHFARYDDPLSEAARCGKLRRNFQGYTTDTAQALIGFGASSIGSLPQGYVQNHPTVPAWRQAVRAGTLATARGVALTPDDRVRRAVIETIMCDMAVDLAAVARRFDSDPATLMDAAPALQMFERDGLVKWSGYQVAVTERGRPFVRGVAAAFDARLAGGPGRHVTAV